MDAKLRVVLCLCCAATLLAQTAPPPIPPELRARFGFVGPLAAKIGDGIGNLRVGDLDGDGKLEAVVVDARRARLVAVRAKGTETSIEAIPTDGQIAGYALADVHGDGKADLLVVDGRGRLTIRRPNGEKGEAPLDLGLGGRGLLTGDLDGDGKADVVVLGRGTVRWVTKIAEKPLLSSIDTIDENARSFYLCDFDGDKKLDLVCVAPGTAMNLRLRHGRGDGTFGPWHIVGIDNLHHVFPAKLADGTPALASIEGANRRVALHVFVKDGVEAAREWWALPESQGNKALPFAVGDLDHDGGEDSDVDLALVQPERAQLLFFEWKDGTFAMRTLPTLAGVASVAAGDVDRDGVLDLVFASPEEEAVSWKSGALPLDQFPTQLACVDKPVAVAVDPNGGVLVLARTEKREAHLDRVAPGQDPVRLVDLGRLPADPVRLFAADIGDAEGLEVAFVVPGEGLRTVATGTVAKKAGKAAETAGFAKKLDDGSLALCAYEGQPALLAVRERFVRRFRIDDKGQVRVLTQDNGPAGMTELSLAADLGGGRRLYLDKKENKLVRTSPDGALQSIEVPPFDFTHLIPHGDAALLIGARGVLRVPFGRGPSLRQVAVHQPPTDRTHYWHGESGDFDNDGIADLVMIDRQLPGVQVLAGTKDGLARALAIPVFEAGPGGEPENEPRELATGDLDGDGRCDFVLLAHDRILIYLQEK